MFLVEIFLLNAAILEYFFSRTNCKILVIFKHVEHVISFEGGICKVEYFFLSLVQKESFVHLVEGNFGLVDLFSSQRFDILVLKLDVHFHA